jgi:hypothetical protein
MQIQVDTDNTVDGNEALISMVEAEVQSALGRFEDRLTRVEVHLGEEPNEEKRGGDAKRCLVEARPAKMQPVVVTGSGGSLEQACKDGTRKMQVLLTSTFGRIADRDADDTIRLPEEA